MNISATRASAIRVFVIDDHRLFVWGLERLIEGAPGMELAGSAAAVAEALERLEKAAPNVILLDVVLGNENGLDAMPAFLARSKARILALTDSRDDSVHEDAVLRGASGVVDKGVTCETLLTAIRKVHEGQLWVDRTMAGRILVEFSRRRADPPADPERPKISKLTGREREIIAVCSANLGGSAKSVARALRISENTLRNHLSSIYGKLGVGNRAALYSYAEQHHLSRREDR